MAIGDMPSRKNVKFGEMKSGKPHMPEEWETMNPGELHLSEKWHNMDASSAKMPEKWEEQDAGDSPFSDKWHEMQQTHRKDPYTSMAPSEGDRTQPFKPMKKEKADNKQERFTAHDENGSRREI